MTTLILQPDASAGIDTFILGNNAIWTDLNWGIATRIQAGNGTSLTAARSRGLLKFNLSALPSAAKVISAVLTLYCYDEAEVNDRNVSVHRALTEWFEGIQNEADPPAGEDGSTYNRRNNNGSVVWAGGAGGGSGSDYAAVATDTQLITTTGASFDWDVTADVEAWAEGVASNHGWFILGAESFLNSRKNFRSSDAATESQRPKLTIEYSIGHVHAIIFG